tara:strand:+ start:475 stop:648 length:174 start_codon:yes stop_codon:yes gene_type:complete
LAVLRRLRPVSIFTSRARDLNAELPFDEKKRAFSAKTTGANAKPASKITDKQAKFFR